MDFYYHKFDLGACHVAAGLMQVKALTGHAVGYKKTLNNAGKVRNCMCLYQNLFHIHVIVAVKGPKHTL